MEIKLPKLGEGADTGVVVSILVKVGDTLEKDQTILELENEKAVAPIPSPQAGVVENILVKEGQTISSGQVILILKGGASAAPKKTAAQIQPQSAPQAIHAPAQQQVNYQYQSQTGAPPPASPSLRKIARQIGLDLTRIPGSGPGGRIEYADVQRYVAQLQFAPQQSQSQAGQQASVPQKQVEPLDFSQWGTSRREKVSSLRNVIARRMKEAWQEVPHVTQFDEADLSLLMDLRKKYKDKYAAKGGQLTVTVFLLKAVAEVLKAHPIFNTSFDEASNEIVYKEYIHVGVAVDTESGLIVPVVRDVDKKTLLELSVELQQLAQKTRERKVGADELKGGSFTISNLGGIGGTHFTPIINRPEVSILGVGRGVTKPAVVEGKIMPRIMLPLALSYDHRVIDGADAARFISSLVKKIEEVKEEALKL